MASIDELLVANLTTIDECGEFVDVLDVRLPDGDEVTCNQRSNASLVEQRVLTSCDDGAIRALHHVTPTNALTREQSGSFGSLKVQQASVATSKPSVRATLRTSSNSQIIFSAAGGRLRGSDGTCTTLYTGPERRTCANYQRLDNRDVPVFPVKNYDVQACTVNDVPYCSASIDRLIKITVRRDRAFIQSPSLIDGVDAESVFQMRFLKNQEEVLLPPTRDLCTIKAHPYGFQPIDRREVHLDQLHGTPIIYSNYGKGCDDPVEQIIIRWNRTAQIFETYEDGNGYVVPTPYVPPARNFTSCRVSWRLVYDESPTPSNLMFVGEIHTDSPNDPTVSMPYADKITGTMLVNITTPADYVDTSSPPFDGTIKFCTVTSTDPPPVTCPDNEEFFWSASQGTLYGNYIDILNADVPLQGQGTTWSIFARDVSTNQLYWITNYRDWRPAFTGYPAMPPYSLVCRGGIERDTTPVDLYTWSGSMDGYTDLIFHSTFLPNDISTPSLCTTSSYFRDLKECDPTTTRLLVPRVALRQPETLTSLSTLQTHRISCTTYDHWQVSVDPLECTGLTLLPLSNASIETFDTPPPRSDLSRYIGASTEFVGLGSTAFARRRLDEQIDPNLFLQMVRLLRADLAPPPPPSPPPSPLPPAPEPEFWNTTTIYVVAGAGLAALIGIIVLILSFTLTPERAASIGTVFNSATSFFNAVRGKSSAPPATTSLQQQLADMLKPKEDDTLEQLRKALESKKKAAAKRTGQDDILKKITELVGK